MVVEYRSGGEGSFTTCCTVVPCVFGQCYGSVVPHVLPQVLLVIGVAVLSRWWNPLRVVDSWGGGSASDDGQEEPDLAQAMQIVGVLLAFLMVFKTQSAYGQFWEVRHETRKPRFLSD
jgi:predicted membrane chloride channel (bestrophin family)